MRCHLCNRVLIEIKNEYNEVQNKIGCPEDHCVISFQDNIIVSYNLLWDADSHAKSRYWLDSFDQTISKIKIARFEPYLKDKGTVIYKSTYGNPYRFNKILELNTFTPLEIKNDVIQLNNIITRLPNLIPFI